MSTLTGRRSVVTTPKEWPRARTHRLLTVIIFAIFLPVIGGHLPKLWEKAAVANQISGQAIPTVGDDIEYQLLAVNMLHGIGYVSAVRLPIETYHLDPSTPWGKAAYRDYAEGREVKVGPGFYRAPGFPLLLTATYAVFGNEPLVARRMLAVLAWATALLLLLIGTYLAGWLGAVAGGLTGLYFLNFYPGFFGFVLILTEIPTAFWVATFCLLFIVYLRKRRLLFLILSAAALACVVFTRGNWLIAPVLFACLSLFQRFNVKELLTIGAIVIFPVVVWSTFATLSFGQFVPFTTQGAIAFPHCNNVDVLEGIGPERSGQGDWQPGVIRDHEGRVIGFYRDPQPGEDGWLKGLAFWRDNLRELPRLFYVKLRLGFWYNNGASVNELQPERLHLVGIAFLLAAVGLRQPTRQPRLLGALSSAQIVAVQLALIALLLVTSNKMAFWVVLLVWCLIGLLAVVRPYGDRYQLYFPPPTWFLAFVACHAVITMLFIGTRYHWPLDPLLMLFALLGLGLVSWEFIKGLLGAPVSSYRLRLR